MLGPLGSLTPRTVRRVLVVLAATATIIIAAQERHRAIGIEQHGAAGEYINDFDRWMIMTPAFLRERVDYLSDAMPTPPLTLLIFAPFTALSRGNAQFAWVLVKLPLVLAIYVLVAAIVARAGVTLTAGALIGLAAAIKLTPLAFIGYFAWRRRWRIAAASAASMLLCWFAILAVVFGWTQNLRWFDQWAHIMLLPYVTKGTLGYVHTQLVGSFALRTLMHVPAFNTSTPQGLVPHYVNVASLSGETIGRLVRVLMIAVAAAGERTWIHHYVTFVLTLGAGAMIVSDISWPAGARRNVTAAILVFFAITLLASEAGRVFGPDGVDWMKTFGVYLLPSIALTAVVLGAASLQRAAV